MSVTTQHNDAGIVFLTLPSEVYAYVGRTHVRPYEKKVTEATIDGMYLP